MEPGPRPLCRTEHQQGIDCGIDLSEDPVVDTGLDDVANAGEVLLTQLCSLGHRLLVGQSDDFTLERDGRGAILDVVDHEGVERGRELLGRVLEAVEHVVELG